LHHVFYRNVSYLTFICPFVDHRRLYSICAKLVIKLIRPEIITIVMVPISKGVAENLENRKHCIRMLVGRGWSDFTAVVTLEFSRLWVEIKTTNSILYTSYAQHIINIVLRLSRISEFIMFDRCAMIIYNLKHYGHQSGYTKSRRIKNI